MDIAILTGADTRFGDSVARTLLRMGFRVYAIGKGLDANLPENRYYHPLEHNVGDLSGLRNHIQDILQKEGRIDLLLTLGHQELDNKWDSLKAEALVRRLHGCLTEVLLAAHICLPSLRAQKGFWIHIHRRSKDGSLQNAGFFESSIEELQNDLQKRYEQNGLRVARVLSSFPETSLVSDTIQQDLSDSIARALEVILRQKETCVIREMYIAPRESSQGGSYPNLVPEMDPYQTTVLPPASSTPEPEPILIPTEKPKHYVQIAEVEEIDSDDSGDSSPREKNENRRRRRRGGRNRRNKPQQQQQNKDSQDSQSPEPAKSEAKEKPADDKPTPQVEKQDTPQKPPQKARKKTAARKVAKKTAVRGKKTATKKVVAKKKITEPKAEP